MTVMQLVRHNVLRPSDLDDHFLIDAKKRNYTTQYANLYFLRLAILKPVVLNNAEVRWSGLTLHDGRSAAHTPRVLDVQQGELTWLVGTLYMEMPLKPNILEDITAEHWLAAAVPKQTWRDPRRDSIQLEDESGRVQLIGAKLLEEILCTGIVVGVLGSETSSGEFEVIDIVHADLPPGRQISAQEDVEMTDATPGIGGSNARPNDEYVAIVSGLEISGTDAAPLTLSLLLDFLTGDLLDEPDQQFSSRISALIVAGNSITSTPLPKEDAMSRRLTKNKKYGYDAASYNPRPIVALDDFLAEISATMQVIVMPGDKDPTNSTMPQQPVHKVMLKDTRKFDGVTLKRATNPTYLDMAGKMFLGCSGQTVDDIAHYIATDPVDQDVMADSQAGDAYEDVDVLAIMESCLRWRHMAPTAPDTLWTYPYSDQDPFIMKTLPDVYFLGNQAKFDDRLVEHTTRDEQGEQTSRCRLITVPKFIQTGELVLVNLRTLEVELITFEGC
ncbi:DNA polymerase alpha/epsilon subunit B-domain-containing protein [Protomyces lactucae-debilis]|uniref:DNA-directed DNA polymerase n=1 Tax=Protomyces lactucae-debilis TaxID=2754530 RepID=A0A1Y2FUG3_PROLT|nr:DNA polymerase alpha/epsilon subunit B-domain-containing protein [Protomyces lactucae-debilis]ORY87642.1 DNA polymerase alpha/epsilon subunit B-domain-containing protein [Protomyces lactucae-debilis]